MLSHRQKALGEHIFSTGGQHRNRNKRPANVLKEALSFQYDCQKDKSKTDLPVPNFYEGF